jgi:hypothetical protein
MNIIFISVYLPIALLQVPGGVHQVPIHQVPVHQVPVHQVPVHQVPVHQFSFTNSRSPVLSSTMSDFQPLSVDTEEQVWEQLLVYFAKIEVFSLTRYTFAVSEASLSKKS